MKEKERERDEGKKTTITTYHYKEMLARQHTVYCIRAICHQAINMDIVLQQFGKFSDMVLSVSVVVSIRYFFVLTLMFEKQKRPEHHVTQ